MAEYYVIEHSEFMSCFLSADSYWVICCFCLMLIEFEKDFKWIFGEQTRGNEGCKDKEIRSNNLPFAIQSSMLFEPFLFLIIREFSINYRTNKQTKKSKNDLLQIFLSTSNFHTPIPNNTWTMFFWIDMNLKREEIC